LKKSTAVPNSVPLWRQQLHYRLKEGALIAFGALCLYLMMALLTYDQNDPGWSHTSSSVEVQNAAGRAGAFCADILFMVLGYFAYIFPLLLAVKAWQVFRHRHEPWQWSGWLFSWRVLRWRTSISTLQPVSRVLPVACWAKSSVTWPRRP
jgi:S-DNA-T family DNA segregation ATPase FtsK/SpoIIIE